LVLEINIRFGKIINKNSASVIRNYILPLDLFDETLLHSTLK